MKKYFVLSAFIALLAVCFLTTGDVSTSAQKGTDRAADREMAEYIKTVTNRTTEGLVERRSADGSDTVDMDGRYQSVMVARLEDDGEMGMACIDNLDDANSFFGKDLETGRSLPKSPSVKSAPETVEDVAKRHGMSVGEYEKYVAMINEMAKRQNMSDSPEAATITIQNIDGAGEGFNDPTLPVVSGEGGNPGVTRGEQRLNVFQHAAGIWGAFLDSNVPITIRSQFNPQTCTASSATLGSAGATSASRNFTNAPMANMYYHAALANKIRNSDGDSATPEIQAIFNSNLDNGCFSGSSRFYYGLNTSTTAGTTNLLVVVLHEMGHGLGFSSLVSTADGSFFNGSPDTYTYFIYDRETGKFWDEMTNAERLTSRVNDGDVFWYGNNVTGASGNLTAGRDPSNGTVQLHTPTTFAAGSSVSHFSTSVTPSVLMEPSITPALDTSLDLTRQQMRDIGWYRDTTGDQVADTITNVTLSGTPYFGSTVNINWTNVGGFNRNVMIELSTDGGTTFPTVIASNIANTGSYTWTVPSTPTTQGRIRVREFNFIAPTGASASNFVMTSPTAASVTVAGRVLTSGGRAIGRANVMMIDSQGNLRSTQTNSFGHYYFEDVEVGRAYIINVSSKLYSFEPQLINVNENVINLDFTAK